MKEDEMSQVSRIHDVLGKAEIEYSAYSCNGINVFGDSKSIDAVLAAFRSHEIVDSLRNSLRQDREQIGKLQARLAILGDNNANKQS